MTAPLHPSSGNELVRQIADEIESSDGLYLMGTKRQLGIAKTAVVIGILRNALDAARSPQAQAGETYSGQTATNLGATIEVVGAVSGVAQAEPDSAAILAGAQALADDVWHPPQPLRSLALYEQTKFKRQAQLVLEAASSVSSTNSGDAA